MRAAGLIIGCALHPLCRELALALAKRGNLPGAEGLIGQQFDKLYAAGEWACINSMSLSLLSAAYCVLPMCPQVSTRRLLRLLQSPHR